MQRLICLALLIFSVSHSFAVTVQKVQAFVFDDHVRVTVSLSGKTTYHHFSLDDPDRIVIDVKNATKSHAIILPTFKHVSWISGMRSAENTPGTLRFVMDLTIPARISSHVVDLKQSGERRVVFDVYPRDAATKPKVLIINKTATTDPNNRDIMVVIDPGHGGKDPGAIGPRGAHEKVVVLAIANYLQTMIDDTPGMRAKMTRDSDYFVSLRGRTNIARKDKADVFIAIHADTFKDSSARGASVFALSERGATSEAARWLAQHEDTSELMGGVGLDDKSDTLKSVLLDLSQTVTINRSLILGRDVLNNLDKVARLHHSRVEQARFVVLKSPDIPSVLVETGFLSNRHEESQLTQAVYQKKMAYAIYQGIQEYMYAYPPQGTKILQWVRDGATTYQVQKGDSLSAISVKFHVSVNKIKTMNHLKSDTIAVGQTLKV